MRLNIEWIAPWYYKKSIKKWIFNKYLGQKELGCTLLGFHITITKKALWSGIEFSINFPPFDCRGDE